MILHAPQAAQQPRDTIYCRSAVPHDGTQTPETTQQGRYQDAVDAHRTAGAAPEEQPDRAKFEVHAWAMHSDATVVPLGLFYRCTRTAVEVGLLPNAFF